MKQLNKKELSKIQYPNYEIIVINDGSSDNTSEVVMELLNKYDKARFIDLKENNGKANALYLGLLASKGEILMGVDSDAYLMPDALNYIVPHFINRRTCGSCYRQSSCTKSKLAFSQITALRIRKYHQPNQKNTKNLG